MNSRLAKILRASRRGRSELCPWSFVRGPLLASRAARPCVSALALPPGFSGAMERPLRQLATDHGQGTNCDSRQLTVFGGRIGRRQRRASALDRNVPGNRTYSQMRIEAVIVCVGYGDFLAASLPENLHLFDDLVVVTSPDDEETRAICRKHSVHHVLSHDHRRDGPFNKARMIQRGFDQIGAQDWILHLDADIVLPRKFRKYLDWAHVDERSIYGADRCNLNSWDEWQRLKQYAEIGRAHV